MAILLDLRMSINSWNAVKFILFELLVSLVFARCWESFVRNRAYRMICDGRIATIFTSGIGRLTPAHIMVTKSKVGDSSTSYDAAASKCFLLLANILLLTSLLMAEYGSTSKDVYTMRQANVTEIARHKHLVHDLLDKKKNVSTLYPLKLTVGDFVYNDTNQSEILLNVRTRDKTSNAVLITKKTQPPIVVGLCGMQFPSCGNPGVSGKNAFGVYEIREGQRLKDSFLNPNFVPIDVNISTSIKQIGWIDRNEHKYRELNETKIFENSSCILMHFVHSMDGNERQLLHCAEETGDFVRFFMFRMPTNEDYKLLYSAKPNLKDTSGALYSISELDEKSTFGIEKRFVSSTTVALVQILHYPRIVRALGGTEQELRQVLKEQSVWAILGMVSGNSAIKPVLLKTNHVNAAVNLRFLFGFGTVFFMCFILFTYNCVERFTVDHDFHVPVTDADLLGQLRKIGGLTEHSGEEKSRSVKIFKRKNEDSIEYLSFAPGPL